jgi:acetyltransferase-like isoleucine patch superfamily enzyme
MMQSTPTKTQNSRPDAAVVGNEFYVHPTADVSPQASIGTGTRIWNRAQVREGAVLGANCNIGKDAYIDFDVRIGDNVKVQNSALIYHGATLEDGVFVGPQACLTNDLYPRAINPDGSLKSASDWEVGETVVRYGASIGAGAIIVTGVEIGRFAMIGAGAVVTRDVPAHGLALGVPARLVGYVCACGARVEVDEHGCGRCPRCQRLVEIGADSR